MCREQEGVERANDLDEVATLHAKFLHRMRDRCRRRMAELLPCCCLAPPCVASCSPYARVAMRVPAWPRGERAAMAGAGVLHARAACVTGWAAMYRMMSADTANTHTAGACCIPRLLWSPIQVPPPSS